MIDLPPILARLDKIIPNACCVLQGDEAHPALRGRVLFYETNRGVLIRWDFYGLPVSARCDEPILGMHIHEGSACQGPRDDPFRDAGGHYNPGACEHPYHAGDLPPVFSCHGLGYGSVLTDRFSVAEILGKTVVLHAMPDDFTTQPAGNSGMRIACGVIEQVEA